MAVQFGTKAETLERLSPVLVSAQILPILKVTVERWLENPDSFLREVKQSPFSTSPLIVRSSARSEDTSENSAAGAYLSVGNISGEASLRDAIERVAESYSKVKTIAGMNFSPDTSDQVMVQPMLEDVRLCGVAFSRDPNTGADYYVINYDDTSGSTSSVTGGETNDLQTFFHFRNSPHETPTEVADIIQLLQELEQHLECDNLDIEFARDSKGKLYLLQCRQLASVQTGKPQAEQTKALESIEKKFTVLNQPHPYLYGQRTLCGVMPDWNPAEIIGVRPNPLALSLYKEIVTDSTWAYQRNNYGYKNLRSFPLLVDFAGIPYIDVRVSFNSFLPQQLSPELSEKLVNYYLKRLHDSPCLHDKVEFEIIFSCYTLDFQERVSLLQQYGFTASDCEELSGALRHLTNDIIHSETGLWRRDTERIEMLDERFQQVCTNIKDPVSQIYWLLEDCKRYGTLPFAGLARAGFIAVQILRSLVTRDVLSEDDYQNFLRSLKTVSSEMSKDFSLMSKAAFLDKYGHLRPGTYDITSPRYDQAPDDYFDWDDPQNAETEPAQPFMLSLDQLKRTELLLKSEGLTDNILGLFDFIRGAIEGREYAKFVFTRSLSQALQTLQDYGQTLGFTRDDCAMADIRAIYQLYGSSDDPRQCLERSIEVGRKKFELTQSLALPALITEERDIWSYKHLQSEPNFVTLKSVAAHTKILGKTKEDLSGKIIFIPNADPGFDWLFTQHIAGFVTMYGGTNSHMAIRAGELGIPAIIGCGETLYEKWQRADRLEIDCSNKLVRILK